MISKTHRDDDMENNEERPVLSDTLEKYYEDIVKTALVGTI
jgi:hypothetical protein